MLPNIGVRLTYQWQVGFLGLLRAGFLGGLGLKKTKEEN